MDTKYTPGPWSIDRGSTAVPNRFVRDNDGNILCYCEGTIAQAHDNARLIAAAPDFVDEIQALLARAQHLGDGYVQVCTQDIEALQELLTKVGVTPLEPASFDVQS